MKTAPSAWWNGFRFFRTTASHAFSYLGLINITTLTLGIPIYLALCHAHWRTQPAFAALAAVFFFVGTAIYIASNTVFSMFALSQAVRSHTGDTETFFRSGRPCIISSGR